MKRLLLISFLFALVILQPGCLREPLIDAAFEVPVGTPVTLCIGFGTEEMLDVQVGTKAEASRVDESNVHDLYVMIFDDDTGEKFYGRHYTFEHLTATSDELYHMDHEGWFVDNVTIADVNQEIKDKTPESERKRTRGLVKISTETRQNCTLVVLANLSNTVFSLDGQSAVRRLEEIQTMNELKQVKVVLEQNVMNRKNLFLMLGTKSFTNKDIGSMTWGGPAHSTSEPHTDWEPNYDGTGTRVELTRLDAKIKFRITIDQPGITEAEKTISHIEPRYWQAFRVPESCFLYPNNITWDTQQSYFNGEESYFETTETDTDTKQTWQVFTFYMLENRQTPLLEIANAEKPSWYTSKYYLRELQEKLDNQDYPGYKANGKWIYAREDATYVQFDAILTLTENGIGQMQQGIAEAMTTDAIFTVHLGNFADSRTGTDAQFDDYNTYRGHSYTYDITIVNTTSIYVEVRGENGTPPKLEKEPGQEGSLLLTTTGIINCDAHYEYHSLEFAYDPQLGRPLDGFANRKKYAWYIKTPFAEGGGTFNSSTGWYEVPNDDLDYRWVKFGLNNILTDSDPPEEGLRSGDYSKKRQVYPGDFVYNEDWIPGSSPYPVSFQSGLSSSELALLKQLTSEHPEDELVPRLMDVNQLINFLFWQNELRYRNEILHDLTSAESQALRFDVSDHLRITAFVDEYYYERNPLTDEVDPDLWRQFVNAKPRELHILSDSEHSLDRASDVIVSSHSIVQQSIQSIYNNYAPDLSSLWGTEHKDEMSWKSRLASTLPYEQASARDGWPWWPDILPSDLSTPETNSFKDDENGRLNTAGIWSIREGAGNSNPQWKTFLEYSVRNDTPELKEDYYYQAFSCMARNRDNNGNGTIDPEELRWYIGSINQLVGMWVGNESLSLTARLYQPVDPNDTKIGNKWRSVTISSTGTDITNPSVIRAEEGATKSAYDVTFTGYDLKTRRQVTSVRCLRNIGTYKDRGIIEDISYAPLDYMVDQYYDCEAGLDQYGKAWPNSDGSGTYTIRFTRLNTKSIRDYTSGDLPYHEEESLNNRVYLRFTAQNPDDCVYADGKIPKEEDPKKNGIREQTLNDRITRHNDYCPPGYRLPNMTELLMMASILPDSYWNRNNTSKNKYPCRTYYSRGIIGSRQSKNEENKIGWSYNFEANPIRVNMANATDLMTGIRCVRDDNMIGDITGKISVVDSDHQRIGQEMQIDLNFTSMNSVIKDVKVKLCYVDVNGREREEEITRLRPSDLTLRKIIKYTIPNLSYLSNVRGFLTVRAEVLNAAGIERVFEAPVRLVSDLYTSIKLLPYEYDPEEITGHKAFEFPVLITAAHMDTKVTSWNLIVTTPDQRTQTLNIDTLVPDRDKLDGTTTYASAIYKYKPGELQQGTYTFQMEAVCGDVTTRSEVVSMDILKVDFDPLEGVNMNNVHQASDIAAYKWEREMIEGLDFSADDFIETDMDISRCVYIPYPNATNPDSKKSLGMDNLISFGVNDIDWVPWTLHVCYPSLDTNRPGSRWLYFTPAWGSLTGTIGWSGLSYSVITATDAPPTAPMHIRLDKNGCHWNGRWMDVSSWPTDKQGNVQSVMDKLANAKTVYIGSVEDVHRSRAIYRFIRVVRNGRYSTTRDGNDNFESNPIHGGNL